MASLVYSNARVKAMENTLLSSEKITRMSFASSLEEGVKILYESNYGGGVVVGNPYMFDDILKAEQNRFTDFMREAMPTGSGLECFLFVNDYHNAKAVTKAKYSEKTLDYNTLAPSGMIERETLKTNIMEKNYLKLPDSMAVALIDIEKQFQSNPINPRFIDITLDKALNANIVSIISKLKVKSIRQYFISNIDFMNISSLLRCVNLNLDEKFFKSGFIEGGSIYYDNFGSLIGSSYQNITEKFKYTNYGKLVDSACDALKNSQPLTIFEAGIDNYFMDIFKSDKYDIFSVAPIAGFYVAKRIELKMVRMILVALKNKVEINQIKQRLRGFYA